jgi:hypothetical protein
MQASDSLTKVCNIAVRGSVDLTIGTLIAMGIDNIAWFKSFNILTDTYWIAGAKVYAQAILALLVASEVREFFNLDVGDDPTGGILFISCLWTRQPNFWSHLDTFVGVTLFKIYTWVSNFGSAAGTGTTGGSSQAGGTSS